MQRLNGAVAILVAAPLEVALVELVFVPLRQPPQVPPRAHRHVDDAAGPDVDGARVELVVDVLLRRDVGGAAAQPGHHVRLLLPGHAEALAVAEVGDLEAAVRREQQVLRLQVPVRHPHFVDVLDPAHQLFEVAVGFHHFEFARGEDERV